MFNERSIFLLKNMFYFLNKGQTFCHYNNMKNIIESVLVKHLGKYVDGLKNSLDIGLLDGEVTIENVSLKTSFINQLGLPFTLRYSHIEKIHIYIPWTSLKDKSTVVTVKDYDQKSEEINTEQVFKGMLERIKMEMKKKWTQSPKDETFAQKNLIRIVDNAILKINNIHIRFQSYKRNWDYSIGMIIDNINSYTVDDYQQKSFYQRSFSKKENNKPFNKLLNIQTFQVYFNDNEQVFIMNQQPKNRALLLKMMAHPFAFKEKLQQSPPGKKKHSDKSNDQIKTYHTYSLKNIAVIALQAIGTQRFAEDMRYNVELNVNITKIDISLSDRQLSQLIYMVQHFYDFALNKDKNGGKQFIFEQATKKAYRSVITKIARDQKITRSQSNQIEEMIYQVPTSLLQEINDEVINNIRIEKQVKKINKVSNTEKSKQMMEELIAKKEKLTSMQGVDLFKEVTVYVKIDRIVTALYNSYGNSAQKFSEFGLYNIVLECMMDLNWFIRVSCKFYKQLFKYEDKEITADLYDLKLPWLHISAEIMKDELKKMQVALQKKEYVFDQNVLNDLINWISLIKIKPSLVNYIEELMNYSIDITRVMMEFMFHKGRRLQMSFSMPIVTIKLDAASTIKVDFGHFFGQNSQKNDQYQMRYMQPVQIHSNDLRIFEMGMGTVITLQDKIQKQTTYQQVIFNIPKIEVTNVQEIIRLIYAFRTSGALSIIKKYNELDLLDKGQEEELEGQFYLNKIKHKLNMKLSRTELVFTPVEEIENFPDQKISLIRTKVYKLITGKRYFIVFKEQVDRLVNIVEAVSEKVAGTIFEKLKDYIHQISTSFQWHKYHKTPYKQKIQTLEQIQDVNLTNNVLMTLIVNTQKMSLQFSQDSHLKIQKAGGKIKYNEFNTQASLQLLKVDLIVESEKVIYDASFKGRYEYLQSMCIELEVLKLGYQIKLHQTLTNIIKVASKYELLIFDLRSKRKKKIVQIQEDESRLSQIKSQNSRTDNLFKFLLQKKFSIQTTNISGTILGYCNQLSYIKLDIQKYRNESQPRILAEMKGIVLLSMIQLPLISLKHTSTQLELQLDSINAEIDISVLIYEVIKGQGSLILKQFLKAYRDKQIAKNQLLQSQDKEQSVKSNKNKPKESQMESYLSKRAFILSVDYIRIELSITGHLSLGFLCKNISLEKGRLSWDGLIFTLNNQCISINQNNAILKWTPNTIDFVMTNVKLKLNSKEVIFLFNQLYKIFTFVKRSNFDLLQLVEQEIANPDEKGRVLQQTKKNINIRIQEFQVIYECADRNPLISIRMKPIFLTNQGRINTVNLSIWHLNRSLKLYEPIIEPFQVKIIEKPQSNQLDLLFQNIYVVLTQQLAVDILQQIKLLKHIKKQLQKDQSNELQQMNDQELKFIKRNLFSQHYQEYIRPNFQKTVEYSFTLKIKSFLNSRCLVEVTCGKAQKQILDYQDNPIKEGVIHTINIAQKTSYNSSYQLIQRYQKINLKICLQNHFYYTPPVNVSFLLYDKDNIYITPVTVMDQNGHEIDSHLAVNVQYSEGVYMVDIMSMYTIKNQTNLTLYFRYSDIYSINKFELNNGESIPLALWVVSSVSLGIEQNNFRHLLKLRSEEQYEEGGYHQLSIPKDENCSAKLIIHKQKITHQKRRIPKLKYLKVKRQSHSNDQQGHQHHQDHESSEQEKENQDKQEQANQAHCFTYNIIPGIVVKNHLLFPIKVNDLLYENEELEQLLFLYYDTQKKKEYLKLGLGDGTIHEVFMPDVEQSININLKLYDQNFVIIYLQVRKNKLHQRVLHIYTEVQLVMNVHNMFVPILKTNIYNHYFIMKKQVKNNHSDKIHPSPILKDKFVFSTYHYLLSLEERYISSKLHDCTSNQIILYHSDYDTDLKFRQPESQEDSYVFAVSYNTKIIELQVDQEGRKPDVLECNYTYIMPKYYLINRSEQSFVVQGSIIIRSGQKIALDKIQNIELNVRDQVQFKYMCKSFDESNYILFIRGKEESKQKSDQGKRESQERRQAAHNFANIHNKDQHNLDGISQHSELQSSKHDQIQVEEQIYEEKEVKAQRAKSVVVKRNTNLLNDQKQQTLQQNKQTENKQKTINNQLQIQQEYADEEQWQSDFKTITHRVKMEDIIIFAMSKRVCDYNTISYEIHQWHQWLAVKNELSCPIVLRTKLNNSVLGQEVIESGKTGKIISGLSEKLQINLVLNGEQVILDRYNLNQRLNHHFFLNKCEFEQVVLKETKVKLGRFVLIESPTEKKDKNVYKAITSLNVIICKISISLVLHEQKTRKELVRININHPKMMLLSYKNGLYMGHFKFDQIVAMCKRAPFLVMKDFQGYIQGFKGQFVQRIAVDLKETLQLNLTDQMISTFMGQVQVFQKYVPKESLLQSQEIILQEEQTYHINSIGIKPIQIKLCLKKVLSEMTEEQARLLSKISLSMIEIQDATINLSPIEINVPVKQKHINGITKMYTMEAFVGVASGLNILGNPSQFMSEFQAGRNRGGVIPVVASMVAGISNSISKIIGTIGSGFSQLTFDREFIRNRIKQKNTRAQNFGQGLKSGLKELALSIKDGIVGLVYQPIQGHQEEGGIGILKGTIFGITGLVTKPVSGIFLAISKTIEGINSTITNMDYDSLVGRQLITRPLYHKFKMVRPYRSEDELAYNILLNWYDYRDVQLVSSFLLQSQQGDAFVQLLIVTCSELIMIDLNDKTVILKLKMEELLATGKFQQGIVLYFHDGKAQDSQEEMVFRLSRDNTAKQNLYYTLKSFISLYVHG